MKRRAGLAALTTAALAGCGSSSPPARQFRASASRVCASAAARTARIAAPATPSATVTFLRRGVAAMTPELTDLRRLHPPRALAPEYEAALSNFANELGALRGAVQRLDGGADPISTTAALQRRLSPIEARADGAWRALDVPACVSR